MSGSGRVEPRCRRYIGCYFRSGPKINTASGGAGVTGSYVLSGKVPCRMLLWHRSNCLRKGESFFYFLRGSGFGGKKSKNESGRPIVRNAEHLPIYTDAGTHPPLFRSIPPQVSRFHLMFFFQTL